MRIQLKRLWLVALMIAFMAIAANAPTVSAKAKDLPPGCSNHAVTASEFRPFSQKVWDRDLWEREKPGPHTIEFKGHKIHCAAGPGHVAAMKKRWAIDAAAFYDYRSDMMWINNVTPYYGCTKLGICKWWSLPAYIVSCESGGDYTPDAGLTFGGAYGILVSTWLQYGGGKFASQANYATPKQQDIIARRVWLDVGPSGWACA